MSVGCDGCRFIGTKECCLQLKRRLELCDMYSSGWDVIVSAVIIHLHCEVTTFEYPHRPSIRAMVCYKKYFVKNENDDENENENENCLPDGNASVARVISLSSCLSSC